MTGKIFVNGSENREPARPTTSPRFRGKHGAPLNSSHGPPHNVSHGPPSLNTQNPNSVFTKRPYSPKTPPSRPPRPPSLDLSSRPDDSTPIPRSPNRVKFAPEPQVRPSHPGSPLRPAFRHSRGKSQLTLSLDRTDTPLTDSDGITYLEDVKTFPSHNELEPAVTGVHHRRKASEYHANGQHTNSADTISVASSSASSWKDNSRTAHAVLDLSDSPNQRIRYHTTSSTPHLPLPATKAEVHSRFLSGNTDEPDTSSGFPLSLFPPPPPLYIRKRPKPLVLLPTPSLARLPPSPLFSSNDSTPIGTPTSPRPPNFVYSPKPYSSNSLSKSGRLLQTIPPPPYSPPNTPLPTPPASPGIFTSFSPTSNEPTGRPLRTAQSTSEFRDHRFLALSAAHRTTSSAPAPDLLPAVEASRRRTNSRPEVHQLKSPSYLVSSFM